MGQNASSPSPPFRSPVRAWQAPTAERGLSLPVASYLGVYEHETYGRLYVEAKQGALAFRLGQLSVSSHALGDDRLRVEYIGQPIEAAFQIGSSGAVEGFTTHSPEGSLVFRKK